MTMPLLEGRDGVQKMSKSLNNYIGISESPDSMFGKLMSISDELMWRYFELLSLRPNSDIAALRTRQAEGRNPRDTKFELAHEIVGRFHGLPAAERAHQDFVARFSTREVPNPDAEAFLVCAADAQLLTHAILHLGFAVSVSEARRLMAQGAVRINSERAQDPLSSVAAPGRYLIEVGKRKVSWLTLTRA
jgi:tyrosyl-tRNA synthetase